MSKVMFVCLYLFCFTNKGCQALFCILSLYLYMPSFPIYYILACEFHKHQQKSHSEICLGFNISKLIIIFTSFNSFHVTLKLAVLLASNS